MDGDDSKLCEEVDGIGVAFQGLSHFVTQGRIDAQRYYKKLVTWSVMLRPVKTSPASRQSAATMATRPRIISVSHRSRSRLAASAGGECLGSSHLLGNSAFTGSAADMATEMESKLHSSSTPDLYPRLLQSTLGLGEVVANDLARFVGNLILQAFAGFDDSRQTKATADRQNVDADLIVIRRLEKGVKRK